MMQEWDRIAEVAGSPLGPDAQSAAPGSLAGGVRVPAWFCSPKEWELSKLSPV